MEERKPSTSSETLARTLRSRVRGESTLKGLVKCAGSGSSSASCEASLLLLFSFTFADSRTAKGTSTELEAIARFSSLRSRALGVSTLKGLVKGALDCSGSSNVSCVASLLLRGVSNSCPRTQHRLGLPGLPGVTSNGGSGERNWTRHGRTL